MRSILSVIVACASLSQASALLFPRLNVVLTNDDGWAEKNIRAFDTDLIAAGHNVLLVAPAENESGTGSKEATPTVLNITCEFDTCPIGSSPEGFSSSNVRLNYVNSFPVTTIKFGLQKLAPRFFGRKPDIVVSGFNVGANLGPTTQISGTVGAATEAAKEGVPAIAFSGTTGTQISFTATTPSPNYPAVYAALSTTVTNALTRTAKPFLPPNVYLNVNFAAVTASNCTSPEDFKFVFTRIENATAQTPPDFRTCGSNRLPTETEVVRSGGCFTSISVGSAFTKNDTNAVDQAFVHAKISHLLSCF
ncbi:sure-like protein [Sistotremastrum niveocremeum HHB9708]|uniref:Sure-like protein n=1 Tax=Sistotremastrum niveocremeum HHB9708 TaxID=1314777 RepID=A0A164WMC5_9AGAM|nr:sure-like protein [Sistotremastrum niveocremeum HHB9708]